MSKHAAKMILAKSLGLEDLEPEVPGEVVIADPEEVIVGLDPEENIAETVLDINDDVDEIEEHEDAIETLAEAATTLEAIAITIEEAIQNADVSAGDDAGLSDDGAAMAAVAVSEVNDKLGLDSEGEGAPDESDPMKSAMFYEPSVESFQGGKRRQASMEALDNIKAKLAAIWKAIKEAVAAFYKMVSNFFVGLVSKSAMLARKAKQIEAAAKDMGEGKGEIVFKTSAKLAMGTKFNGAADIVKGLEVLQGYGSKNIPAYVRGVEKVFGQLDHHGAVAGAEHAELSKAIDEAVVSLSGIELPGGYHAEHEANGDGLSGALKSQPHLVAGKNGPNADAKYAPATKEEVVAIARGVQYLASKVVATKKSEAENLKKMAETFVAKAGEAIKKEGIMEATKDRVALTMHMRLGGKPWAKPVVQYAQLSFVACGAALNFCEASIRASRKKAEAAAPAPAAA